MKKRNQHYLAIITFIFFIIQINNYNQRNYISNKSYVGNLCLSTQQQWLENNDFSTQEGWSFINGNEGDNSSVDADISGGKANLHVLGEKKTYTIYGVPNSTNSPGWKRFTKPNSYLPINSYIDSYGCYVDHTWSEGSNQFPGVHFRKNVSLNEDMSKYTITSAFMDVVFNATVALDVEVKDDDPPYYAIGDFITFYVLISDVDFKNSYPVALNRTVNLGRNTGPLTISDKLIEFYSQNVLITALNSAFEKDPTHSNFTITLGIDIYSEDSRGADTDTYNSLRIKDCNLTFTYEKKIEKFTSVSLNQVGNSINGENVQIRDALLTFNYTINEIWPYDLSPFSEIRILINDNPYRETIEFSTLSTSLQHVRFKGTDFTALFREGVNISISIQLYLANTFELNRTLSISIDDMYLYISYIFITPEADLSPLVIGLTSGIIGIVIAFSVYQLHFKYPLTVRKIRKLKKKVRKGRIKKPVLVNKREDIIQDNLNEKKNILNFEPEEVAKIEKMLIKKEGEI